MEFIESQRVLYPDIPAYEVLGDLYEKKLWHQLSLELESFLINPSNNKGTNIIDLYQKFMSTIQTKLNQVKFAKLCSLVAKTLSGNEENINFFQQILEKSRSQLGDAAALCLDIETVLVMLKMGSEEKIKEAKKVLEDAKEVLPTINSTESIVFSKYYQAIAEYRKIIGPPQEFYTAALMFLVYTPVEDLDDETKYKLATDMALASITGEEIFNFGEVIATPILNSLIDTPNQWLRDIVHALYSGDIDQFNLIIDQSKEQIRTQPAMMARFDLLKEKVVLLCVMNIAFERPSHDRQILLSDIADRARIPVNQVEWVLMKAMSLNLIKGTIDEVDSIVNITWVKPRVLDKKDLTLMCSQLEAWNERVKNALYTIEDQTHELYV